MPWAISARWFGRLRPLLRFWEATLVILPVSLCIPSVRGVVADLTRCSGMIRPSEYKPLPEHLTAETARLTHVPAACPCSAFTVSHPNQEKSRTVRPNQAIF